MKHKQISIGREAAVALADERFWESLNHRERAEFQMVVAELSMPFEIFHEAIEKTLGRPVFTHEFGMNIDGLWDELFNDGPAPTMNEIFNLIPEEKRVVIMQ